MDYVLSLLSPRSASKTQEKPTTTSEPAKVPDPVQKTAESTQQVVKTGSGRVNSPFLQRDATNSTPGPDTRTRTPVKITPSPLKERPPAHPGPAVGAAGGSKIAALQQNLGKSIPMFAPGGPQMRKGTPPGQRPRSSSVASPQPATKPQKGKPVAIPEIFKDFKPGAGRGKFHAQQEIWRATSKPFEYAVKARIVLKRKHAKAFHVMREFQNPEVPNAGTVPDAAEPARSSLSRSRSVPVQLALIEEGVELASPLASPTQDQTEQPAQPDLLSKGTGSGTLESISELFNETLGESSQKNAEAGEEQKALTQPQPAPEPEKQLTQPPTTPNDSTVLPPVPGSAPDQPPVVKKVPSPGSPTKKRRSKKLDPQRAKTLPTPQSPPKTKTAPDTDIPSTFTPSTRRVAVLFALNTVFNVLAINAFTHAYMRGIHFALPFYLGASLLVQVASYGLASRVKPLDNRTQLAERALRYSSYFTGILTGVGLVKLPMINIALRICNAIIMGSLFAMQLNALRCSLNRCFCRMTCRS